MMAITRRVLMHGLVVETDLAVTGLVSDREPDVRCGSALGPWVETPLAGEVMAQAESSDGSTTMRVLAEDQRVVVDWPGFMRAHASASPDGGPTELRFSVASSKTVGLVPVMLSPAIGAIAMLRGALVLHATAVLIDGRAVLLLAERGGGKSSVAALLGSAGVPLLSEDVCALTISDSSVVVHAGVQEVRLRTTTPWLADLDGLTRTEVHPDGRIVVVAQRADAASAEVALLVVVHLSRTAERVASEHVSAVRAVTTLMSSQRCPGIAPAGRLIGLFDHASTVASRVPMSIITIPWDEDRRTKELGSELAGTLSAQVARRSLDGALHASPTWNDRYADTNMQGD